MNKILSNNENNLQIGSVSKNGVSARKHPLKKVFGELKNVIHNQGMPTPLKTDTLLTRNPIAKKPLQPNKQKTKLCGTAATNDGKLCSSATNRYDSFDEIHLLDYFDFRGDCCSYPYKSDQQIWAETNLFDDSFLNKITKDDKPQLEEDPQWDIGNYNDNDSDDVILDELKGGFNLYNCPNADPDHYLGKGNFCSMH